LEETLETFKECKSEIGGGKKAQDLVFTRNRVALIYLSVCLFILGLFNDAYDCSEYITTNNEMFI
jgi:hypothetical protein